MSMVADPLDKKTAELLALVDKDWAGAVSNMASQFVAKEPLASLVIIVCDVNDDGWREQIAVTLPPEAGDYENHRATVVRNAEAAGVRPVFVMGFSRDFARRIVEPSSKSVAKALETAPEPRHFWCVVDMDGIVFAVQRQFFLMSPGGVA